MPDRVGGALQRKVKKRILRTVPSGRIVVKC